MPPSDDTPARVRWARLRFQIIGTLLAAPPDDGELRVRLGELAARGWTHPTTGLAVRFSFKTIERWFYLARGTPDPLAILARRVPKHAGTHPRVSVALEDAIARLYREHPRWTVQLHYDNLRALAREDPRLAPLPCYATVRRYMRQRGLFRARKKRPRDTEEAFEVRETALVRGRPRPRSLAPRLSPRLARRPHPRTGSGQSPSCWASSTTAPDSAATCSGTPTRPPSRSSTHCRRRSTSAACPAPCSPTTALRCSPPRPPRGSSDSASSITRRCRIPRAKRKAGVLLGTDRGPFAPHARGRARASPSRSSTSRPRPGSRRSTTARSTLRSRRPLSRATCADPSVGRESPSSDTLRRAFRTEVSRKQRRSDGTVTVEGIRFEVPSRTALSSQLRLRVARWDLSSSRLVDPRSGDRLATLWPLDRTRNAERTARRRTRRPTGRCPSPSGIAPHLRALMADYAATGLPPAFVPKTPH
jgi:putative transposase